jgi:hypothetical protein
MVSDQDGCLVSKDLESAEIGGSVWIWAHTVKNGSRFSRPQPGCHLPNSPRTGIIKLFPARKGLVSDIPAGDGKTANLFYSACVDAISARTGGKHGLEVKVQR